MRQRLNASQDTLNIKKQALYCIAQTQKNVQTQKKQKILNKLSFDFMLGQSKKQKFYANLIPFTAKACPQIFNQGHIFANTQYSSVRVRKHRRQFLSSRRYSENPEHKQSIKKYSNILTQRKKRQQQGGIESFWMFKKGAQIEQIKKKKAKKQGQLDNEQLEGNSLQNAYKRILIWGKLTPDLANSVIPKNLMKNYVASKLGENFASWFINFYQIRTYITFKEFQQLRERFKSIKTRQSHVVSFFLYDDDADGFLSPKDVFGVFEKQLSPKIENDVLKIAQFVKNNIHKKDLTKQQFKIETVILRDDWLTIKDYEMYFKKVDEPYLKATNKKDTVFSKTFAVLDHRQKIRSVRKQMNQKKNMYDQLYGILTKQKKSHVFIDSQDYRLNFAFFYQIFGSEQTQFFKYFCDHVFNI